MEPETYQRLRGSVELAADAVEAAVGGIAEAHQSIARQVYAPFVLLGPLAEPARAIEQIQAAITVQVYTTILGSSRLIAAGALALLGRGPGEPPQAS